MDKSRHTKSKNSLNSARNSYNQFEEEFQIDDQPYNKAQKQHTHTLLENKKKIIKNEEKDRPPNEQYQFGGGQNNALRQALLTYDEIAKAMSKSMVTDIEYMAMQVYNAAKLKMDQYIQRMDNKADKDLNESDSFIGSDSENYDYEQMNIDNAQSKIQNNLAQQIKAEKTDDRVIGINILRFMYQSQFQQNKYNLRKAAALSFCNNGYGLGFLKRDLSRVLNSKDLIKYLQEDKKRYESLALEWMTEIYYHLEEIYNNLAKVTVSSKYLIYPIVKWRRRQTNAICRMLFNSDRFLPTQANHTFFQFIKKSYNEKISHPITYQQIITLFIEVKRCWSALKREKQRKRDDQYAKLSASEMIGNKNFGKHMYLQSKAQRTIFINEMWTNEAVTQFLNCYIANPSMPTAMHKLKENLPQFAALKSLDFHHKLAKILRTAIRHLEKIVARSMDAVRLPKLDDPRVKRLIQEKPADKIRKLLARMVRDKHFDQKRVRETTYLINAYFENEQK